MDLRSKFLFYPIQVEPIFVCDKVDRQPKVTESTRSSNTMEVRLTVFREIEIDNDIHSLNIDTTSEEIRANKVTAYTVPEVMEDSVTMRLEHSSM